MAKDTKASTRPVKIGEVWKVNGSQTLTGVHIAEECSGHCPLHGPSEHSMLDFPLYWREDAGIFERLCPHGIGHIDPDTLARLESIRIGEGWGVHGCDGCCKGAYE